MITIQDPSTLPGLKVRSRRSLNLPDRPELPTLPDAPVRDTGAESRQGLTAGAIAGLLTAVFGRGRDVAGNAAAALGGSQAGFDAAQGDKLQQWQNETKQRLSRYGVARQGFGDEMQTQTALQKLYEHNDLQDRLDEQNAERAKHTAASEKQAADKFAFEREQAQARTSREAGLDAAKTQKDTDEGRHKFLTELSTFDKPSQQTRLRIAESTGDLAKWGLDKAIPKKPDGSFDLGDLTDDTEAGDSPNKSREKRLTRLYQLFNNPRADGKVREWAGGQILNSEKALGIGDGTAPPAAGMSAMTPFQEKSLNARGRAGDQADARLQLSRARLEWSKSAPTAKAKAAGAQYFDLLEMKNQHNANMKASRDLLEAADADLKRIKAKYPDAPGSGTAMQNDPAWPDAFRRYNEANTSYELYKGLLKGVETNRLRLENQFPQLRIRAGGTAPQSDGRVELRDGTKVMVKVKN